MNINKALKNVGLRATAPRIQILRILSGAHEPLSIDDISTKLDTTTEVSTLYRSLKKMSDVGLVYQTDLRQGKAYFAYHDNHQHYIVCTDCGDKEKVDICLHNEAKILQKKSRKFASIKNHMLEFFGLCKKCQN